MATSIGDVFVNVVTDTSGLEDSLSEALERGFSGAKLGGLAGVTAAGVAAVVREFAPLEKEILRISQITGDAFSDSMFNEITTAITGIADQVGVTAEPIANAVAQGVARGFSQQTSLELSKIAGDLAVAAGGEVGPAMQALTAVIAGYGEENIKAADAAETLFETLNLSNAQIPELARQLGNITPSAAGLGITFDEVGAAIGNMTSQGLTLAESTTQLRTLFQELSQSGSKGSKVFEAISGKTFPEFIKQGGDLQTALNLIRAASDQASIPVQDLFGNINSGNAVLANTGASAESYNRILAQTTENTGRLDQAVETANEGSIRKFQIATAGLKTSLDRIGLAIRPLTQLISTELASALGAVASAGNAFASRLSEIDWTSVIDGISRFKAAIAPVGDLINAVFMAFLNIDWAGLFRAAQPALIPLYITFKTIGEIAKILAFTINNFVVPAINAIIPVIEPVIAAFSLLAGVSASVTVALGTVAGAVALFGGGVVAVTYILFKLQKALWAVILLWKASPWGRAIVIITALAAAFTYAWKESETFRNVVRKVWIDVVGATGTAVKGLVAFAAGWVKAYLYAFKAVLDGLAHLPDWLGGGKFEDASNAVQRVIDGVNDIKASLDGMIDSAVNAAKALAFVTSVQDEGFGTNQGQLDEVYAQLAKDYPNLYGKKKAGTPAMPKIPKPDLGALGDLLNPDKDDKAAIAAAKRLADLIKGIYEATQKLVKGIGQKSLDSIESGFEGLIGKYGDAIDSATEQGNRTLAKRLKDSLKVVKGFEKQMLKLAKRRDAAIEKLKTAEQTLKSLKDEADRFNESIKASFISAGSVAEASAGIDVTFRGIRNNLKDAVRTASAFNTAIKRLKALGLNDISLQQLAEAGPAALEQAQALAQSGASGIKEINNLQTELTNIAGKNADFLTEQLKQAGINAAQALVNGLKSEKQALIDEMEDLADALVKAVKKGLKIHSPSQVFDEIGREIPAGLSQGVRRGTPDVAAALQAMASGGITFGPGAIEVNGVSDPAAARRAGILAGEGVAAVLEKRKVAQKLAGVA